MNDDRVKNFAPSGCWKPDTISERNTKTTNVISARRNRLFGEITPIKAENSATLDNKDKYSADHAIDLEGMTRSGIGADIQGRWWFKLEFDKVYCVNKVVEWNYYLNIVATYTCTRTDCSKCIGPDCRSWNKVTVNIEGPSTPTPALPTCKYGDSIKFENTGGEFTISELAATYRGGKY